jgi:hypothetical protein
MGRFHRSVARGIDAYLALIGIGLLLAVTWVSCERAPDDQAEAKKPGAPPKVSENALEITFTYGSEKKRGLKRRQPRSMLKSMQ